MSQIIDQKTTILNEGPSNLDSRQETFVENQTKCPLCDSTLDIRANRVPDSHKIREEAFCRSCNIKTRDKEHLLQ